MRSPFSELRDHASKIASRAHTPFSGTPEAAALLLSDGTWVPGVRVESASYSLVIPPLLNAFTTAVAAKRSDVVAAASSHPFRAEDTLFLGQALGESVAQADPHTVVLHFTENVRRLKERLNPLFPGPVPSSPERGIRLARQIARRAHVPVSGYRVGCVLVGADGQLVPGVNVEHPDWARILCAERNAISTAVTYSIEPRQLFLTCLSDPTGTPCGACRQVLAELAPGLSLWIDRGDDPPEHTSVDALLPGAFRGQRLSLS